MCIFWESVHDVCVSYILLPISRMARAPVFLHSSCAEQLVLYMKAEECLSSALHTAKESISQGDLIPSSPVKQGENFFLMYDGGEKKGFWTSHATIIGIIIKILQANDGEMNLHLSARWCNENYNNSQFLFCLIKNQKHIWWE